MIKKLRAILLTLVLVLALAACAATPTTPPPETRAYELYSRITQLMSFGEDNPSGAYDIDFVMDIEMHMFGEVFNMSSTGNMQMVVDGQDMRSVMVMESDMGDLGRMSMEMYMVFEDNSLTELGFTVDGVDMSEVIPKDMVREMLDGTINMPPLEMEGLTSAKVEEVDGNTVVHLVLDGQMFTEFMVETMDGMMEAMLGGIDLMDFTIEVEDINMTIVVDSNDNPISMTMEMNMQVEIDGETLIMNSTTEYTFNAFGDDVQFTI